MHALMDYSHFVNFADYHCPFINEIYIICKDTSTSNSLYLSVNLYLIFFIFDT